MIWTPGLEKILVCPDKEAVYATVLSNVVIMTPCVAVKVVTAATNVRHLEHRKNGKICFS